MSSNIDLITMYWIRSSKILCFNCINQSSKQIQSKKIFIKAVVSLSLVSAGLIFSAADASEYLVGDWDGDGRDNIAIREGSQILMDTDFNSTHNILQAYGYGDAEDQYLVGDWDGDGRDNLAVRRGSHIFMDYNFDHVHDREIVFGSGNSEDEYFVIKNVVTGQDSVAYRRGQHICIYRAENIPCDETNYGGGNAEDQYLPADWFGFGYDQLAVRRGNKILIDQDFDGYHDWTLAYGSGNKEDQYLVGDWDGDGRDNLAVRKKNHILMDTNFDSYHDIEIVYGHWEESDEPHVVFRDEAAGSGSTEAVAGSQALSQAVPDMEDLIREASLDVIDLLYFPNDSGSDIKSVTDITIVLISQPDLIAQKFDMGEGRVRINLGAEFVAREHEKYAENTKFAWSIRGVLSHELTHAYQFGPREAGDYQSGTDFYGFIEGMADFVRIQLGLHDAQRHTGGHWNDGYTTTGYFIKWIVDSKDPEFGRKFNATARDYISWSWSAACLEILGEDVQSLWDQYQTFVENS